jgi:hypothetical protein
VLVPDAELLFTAQFHRAGPDLVLTGRDGQHHLIPGYFSSEHRPALVAPNGAQLSPDVVDLLAGSPTLGHYAQAQPAPPPETIGKIEKVVGDVTVVRNGVAVALHVGDAVFKSDVVQTGSQSMAGIGFPDGTALNLVANTRMALSDYSYDPNGTSNGALFTLVEGTFQFVAGKVAHAGDMKIATPMATMGIRGTTGFVEDHIGAITSNQGNVHYYAYGLFNDFDPITHRATDAHGAYDITVLNPDGTSTQFTVADTRVEWDVVPGSAGQPAQILAVPLTDSKIAELGQTFRDFLSAHFQVNPQQTNGSTGSSTPPDSPFFAPQAPQFAPNINTGPLTNTTPGGPASGTSSNPPLNGISAPVADPSNFNTTENTAHVFKVADFKFTGNDSADTLTSVIITSLPTDGTLELNGSAVTANETISAADIASGKLTFVPNTDTVTQGTFSFKVIDAESQGSSPNAAAMTITITATAELTATGVDVSAIEGNAVTATVATFTDANPSASVNDFTAAITWGDGTTSTGTITEKNGVFSVTGTHTYAEEGSDPIGVIITDVHGGGAGTTSTATVADAALTATGTNVSAIEGNAVTATVATFTDANPLATTADFTATITWGDGTTSTGTIAETTVNNKTVFTVTGTHTYTDESTDPISVTIKDDGGSTASTTSTATVADAALTATGVDVNAIEGNAITATVATFTDANPLATTSNFTATITWGDGTTSTGTIAETTVNNKTVFTVTGTHTYTDESTDPISVTIKDDGGSTASTTSTATVVDAALTASGTPVSAIEGNAVTATVATFTDANPLATTSNFTATITWGDGTTSTGTIAETTVNNKTVFTVTGTHTYAEDGTDPISVTIKDDGGSTASTTSTATVDPVAEKPVLGGATSASVHMGGLITLGVTETPFDSDDTLGNVTITGLPHDLSDFNGGTYIASSGTWTGTAAQFNALAFAAGHATGTFTLSISAPNTTPGETATATENYRLTIDSGEAHELPILGGATSATVDRGGLVTLGVTETKFDSDDTLGNVTITGLPHDLSNFNGGTYTANSGTWTGTAAQFAALKFDAGDTAGTFTLSISAPNTTPGENATATGNYTLTINSALAPAGIAGEAINLALSEPSLTAVTVLVAGLAAGWSLSEGTNNGNGTWTVQTSDLASLAVTTPVNFAGASVLNVTETWTNVDGSTGHAYVADNVEAFAPGSPIFALAGDDNMTGTGANDLFVLAQPIGNDVIYNFNAGSDKIDLIGFNNVAKFSDIQLVNDANGNAVVTLGSGETITLHGTNAASLTASNFLFDQTPVVENHGNMTIGDGAVLPLAGTIDNTGMITLNSSGDQTEVQIVGDGLTLQGGGQLVLSDSPANVIVGTTSTTTLTNVDNTISGAGQIGLGDGNLTLVNEAHGTIDANAAGGTLIVDTGHTVTNAGLLEASNGGTLLIEDAVNGSGSACAVINGGTLDFGASSNVNVTFNNGAGTATYGELVLGNPENFCGQISGFTGTGPDAAHSDSIDLKGINYNSGHFSETYSALTGALTVTDGSETAHLTFEGFDGTLSFASDGKGGTIITDPAVAFGGDHATFDNSSDADAGALTNGLAGGSTPHSLLSSLLNVLTGAGQDSLAIQGSDGSSPDVAVVTPATAVLEGKHLTDPTIIDGPGAGNNEIAHSTLPTAVNEHAVAPAGVASPTLVSATFGTFGNDNFAFHPNLGSGVSSAPTNELTHSIQISAPALGAMIPELHLDPAFDAIHQDATHLPATVDQFHQIAASSTLLH